MFATFLLLVSEYWILEGSYCVLYQYRQITPTERNRFSESVSNHVRCCTLSVILCILFDQFNFAVMCFIFCFEGIARNKGRRWKEQNRPLIAWLRCDEVR